VTKETSILLPSATVDLFLKDKATIEAAKKLESDWRFARVVVRVNEGDVEDAISLYSSEGSPDIIMVETETTADSFVNRLGALSANCNEKTSAIVIGPVNDVNLYRSLTSIGVSDYLVYPVPIETLSEVIASTLIEKLGASGSRLVAMVGAKGGVGVTALCEAMGWACAENMGQKTLLLDAAGAWSSLGVGMGFEPVASTGEAIKAAMTKDQDSLRRMYYQANDKLFVLATGTEPMLETSPQIMQFEEILNTAMASYPVVIVDLSGSIPAIKKMVMTRAHEIVVVSTPTLSSLRSARALMQEIKKIQGGQAKNIDLFINMIGMAPGKEVPKQDIKSAMDSDPSIFIPFDPKLFLGIENEGRKITSEKGGTDIISQLLPFVQKLTGKEAISKSVSSDDNIITSFFNKLKTKK
jgi:pilus assembly protein CpaE